MRRLLALLCVLSACWASAGIAPEDIGVPEPGPEHRGLRLRLVVDRQEKDGEEIFDVRVDLINTTDKTIVLTADWLNEGDERSVVEYFEACIDIETFPPLAGDPCSISIVERKSPQPKMDLPPRCFISAAWKSTDRRLKDMPTNPLLAHNPRFLFDGLYCVYAAVEIQTNKGKCILRSNEQLVPVGGSYAAPRHTLGELVVIDPETAMGTLNVGSLHKVAVGDTFRLNYDRHTCWRMKVKRVEEEICHGKVIRVENPHARKTLKFPPRGTWAKLITE